MTRDQYDTNTDGPDLPYVHPEQTTIPDAPYMPGESGYCYWCSEEAVYGQIKLGGNLIVNACKFHYSDVVAPALARVAAERERKRIAAHQAKRAQRAASR
jgi:hypothetical protein